MSQDSNSSCRRLLFCADRVPAAITCAGDLFSVLAAFLLVVSLLAVGRGVLVVTVAAAQVCAVIVLTVYALVVTPVFAVCAYHASYKDEVIFNFFSALKKVRRRQAWGTGGASSGHPALGSAASHSRGVSGPRLSRGAGASARRCDFCRRGGLT